MPRKLTAADWILKTMAAVAGADGRLNAREVGLIQKIYRDETGKSVDVSGIVRAVEAYATKHDLLAELSEAAGAMSAELKDEIIRAAYLMLHADEHVAGKEREKLQDIAAALEISETHLSAIVDATESSYDKEPW